MTLQMIVHDAGTAPAVLCPFHAHPPHEKRKDALRGATGVGGEEVSVGCSGPTLAYLAPVIHHRDEKKNALRGATEVGSEEVSVGCSGPSPAYPRLSLIMGSRKRRPVVAHCDGRREVVLGCLSSSPLTCAHRTAKDPRSGPGDGQWCSPPLIVHAVPPGTGRGPSAAAAMSVANGDTQLHTRETRGPKRSTREGGIQI